MENWLWLFNYSYDRRPDANRTNQLVRADYYQEGWRAKCHCTHNGRTMWKVRKVAERNEKCNHSIVQNQNSK